jgi:hypothetical protein
MITPGGDLAPIAARYPWAFGSLDASLVLRAVALQR